MSYYDEAVAELNKLIDQFYVSKKEFDEHFKQLKVAREKFNEDKAVIRQLAKERQIGFPTLAKAYDDYFKLQDKEVVDLLKYKDMPAIKASELVSEYARQRRESEKERRVLQFLVDYYESICPFLLDLKEEIQDDELDKQDVVGEYTEEERADETTNYLTKEEYKKLEPVVRNQMALDRYWKRPKSKHHVGKMYERYVGYLYESQGYDVNFHGIFKGLEDLGRDLIATKGNDMIVIQCKNWSKFKTIYEKHIFQFFGTVFQFKDENKSKNVKAIFYTTTQLSDLARRFSKELGIGLKENYKMARDYPCIKCNVNNGTKIYHLPFDQQYDKVKIIESKGEFYCTTTKEAEDKGFRRAFRWQGEQSRL